MCERERENELCVRARKRDTDGVFSFIPAHFFCDDEASERCLSKNADNIDRTLFFDVRSGAASVGVVKFLSRSKTSEAPIDAILQLLSWGGWRGSDRASVGLVLVVG